jgi:tetratricopeptide (TPR) repeat protein
MMTLKTLLAGILSCILVNVHAQQQDIVTREQVLNMYFNAATAEKNNKPDQAVKIYKTLLSIDPSLPAPYLKLANIYAVDENNISAIDSAIILYKKYLELNPADKNVDALKNTVARLEEKLNDRNITTNINTASTVAETTNPVNQLDGSTTTISNPVTVQDNHPTSTPAPVGTAAETSDDVDVNLLWEQAQAAVKEKNYGIANNLLTRITAHVSPNHPLSAQANIMLANIYGDTGNTAKMQEAINTLESYVEIHEQVVAEMDNTNHPAQVAPIKNVLPLEDDLCGVWISDYSEDKDGLPYIVIEITNTKSKYNARILPHCTLAKKHNMYTGTPFRYTMTNLAGQTANEGDNTTDGKTFLAQTQNIEIQGNNNVAILYFGDEALKKSKTELAESAVQTVGGIVDNPLTDIFVAGLSYFFSEVSSSTTTTVTLDMHIKRLFNGYAEFILAQNFYVKRSSGKKSESQSNKIMRLCKIYPEYNLAFASDGQELFGYKEFNRDEMMRLDNYEQLLKINDRKEFNKQSYKKLSEKVIEQSKITFPDPNSDIARGIDENFEYATQGFSYQEIINKNGTYKGWTDISGKSNGYGHARLNSGHEYLGEWKDSKYYGTGKYTIPGQGVYTGGFLDGKFHGKGIFAYFTEEQYEGEWKNGKKDGTGKQTMPNGDLYEGTWKNDEPLTGKIKYADASLYDGQCRYNKKEKRIEKHGKGLIVYANGQTLSGNWENDVFINKK